MWKKSIPPEGKKKYILHFLALLPNQVNKNLQKISIQLYDIYRENSISAAINNIINNKCLFNYSC